MAGFILAAAIRAVKSKIGMWNAYETIKSIEPGLTREEWAEAIGRARHDLAQKVAEYTKPLNRRPTAADFGKPIEARSRAKYWQSVDVFIKDRETGAHSKWNVIVRTDSIRSRQWAINEAIEQLQGKFDARPQDYPVDITGANYAGTYPIVRPRR